MSAQEKIVKNLIKHKEKNKIVWEDLAHAIGVRAKTLYRLVKNDESKAHPATIMAIERYLETARNGRE